MYTTMFSLLLASAGLASGQQGGYGGFGGYGTPGSYSGSGSAPCYFGGGGYVMPWNFQSASNDDPSRKQVADLAQRVVELEKRLEQGRFDDFRREMAESNRKLEDRLIETLNIRMNETAKMLEAKLPSPNASLPGIPGPGSASQQPGPGMANQQPGPGSANQQPGFGTPGAIAPGVAGPGTQPPVGPVITPPGAAPIASGPGNNVSPAVSAPADSRNSENANIAKILDAIGDLKASTNDLKVSTEQKLSQFNDRLRMIEDERMSRQMDANSKATNEVLHKIVELLAMRDNTPNARPDPQMAQALSEIKDTLRLTLEHFPVKVNSQPIRTGYELTRGLIIVKLPADARLFVDGMPATPGSNVRTFISPELELGKNYFYNLRVEVDRNGRVYTDNQKIYFQAGREVHVSFEGIDSTIANRQRLGE